VLAESPKLRTILAHLERFFGRRERPRALARVEPVAAIGM